jgi:hypothetical protein
MTITEGYPLRRADATRYWNFDAPKPERFVIADLTREDLVMLREALDTGGSQTACLCASCRAARKFIPIINSRIGA